MDGAADQDCLRRDEGNKRRTENLNNESVSWQGKDDHRIEPKHVADSTYPAETITRPRWTPRRAIRVGDDQKHKATERKERHGLLDTNRVGLLEIRGTETDSNGTRLGGTRNRDGLLNEFVADSTRPIETITRPKRTLGGDGNKAKIKIVA